MITYALALYTDYKNSAKTSWCCSMRNFLKYHLNKLHRLINTDNNKVFSRLWALIAMESCGICKQRQSTTFFLQTFLGQLFRLLSRYTIILCVTESECNMWIERIMANEIDMSACLGLSTHETGMSGPVSEMITQIQKLTKWFKYLCLSSLTASEAWSTLLTPSGRHDSIFSTRTVWSSPNK